MASAISSIVSFDNMIDKKREKLTSLQFSKYLPTRAGIKIIIRNATVDDINTSYQISIKHKTSPTKVNFTYYISDHAIALELNKRQEYTFSGKIIKCHEIIRMTFCRVDITGFE